MPFNENGQFIRVHNWTEDKSNNIPITASRMDAEDNGFATGLSQTFLRDGSVALTGDLKAGNYKLTGLANGTADTDAVTLSQLNTVQGNAVLLTGDQTVAGVKTFTSSPIAPTVSADDNSTKVATTAWVNTTGNNVVHKTGDETISGYKVFSNITLMNGIRQYSNNVTKGTAPSSTQYINMYMTDSSQASGDANAMGLFRTIINTDNTVYSQLQAFKNEAGSQAMGHLRVTYDTTNNTYFASIGGSTSGINYSLTRETNSTTVQTIPTMGWVNNPATSTNVVHRSGNETISGSKTFTYNPYISNVEPRLFLNSTDITRGTAPSAKEVLSVNFQDANSDWFGYVQGVYDTDKSVGMFIGAKKSISSSDTASVYMGIGYDSSGNPYTSAPTPIDTYSSTSGTQIATTGWTATNFVNTIGTQTVGGVKTFTGDFIKQITSTNGIRIQHTGIIKGTTPSDGTTFQFVAQDKTATNAAARLGGLTISYNSNGNISTSILAYKPESGSSTSSSIQIIYPASGSAYTYAPTPTDTSSTSSQQIATVGWVNNPATSTNVVHRSGNETIAGTKTFTSDTYIKNASAQLYMDDTQQTKGTAPSADTWSAVTFHDANGNLMGRCRQLYANNKKNVVELQVHKANSSSDTDYSTMGITYPASGNPYGFAPTPTDSYSTTSGTQIATTGWVGSNFVNLAGVQTISGGKTFTSNLYVNNGDPRVFLKHSSAIKGTAPSSTLVSSYQVRDKNNELLGSVHTQYYSDKSILTQIVAYKANNSSDTASSRISVGYDTNGNVVTAAPASDVNNSIVTTINKSKAENGYFQFGNGLIIQWGRVSNTTDHDIPVTFPKAFTSTNYSINAMRTSQMGGYSYDGITGVSSRATTSCVLYSYYGSSDYDWIAIGY